MDLAREEPGNMKSAPMTARHRGVLGPLGYSTLLVATDGSASSSRAGEHAVYLAESLVTKLVILSVVHVFMEFHSGIHYGAAVKELERAGKEATREIAALATESDVECEEFVVTAAPARAIATVAEDAGADLIVVGTAPASRLERALPSSVSESVIRHAGRPVLVVDGNHWDAGISKASDEGRSMTNGRARPRRSEKEKG